jgi:hypothetical protein
MKAEIQNQLVDEHILKNLIESGLESLRKKYLKDSSKRQEMFLKKISMVTDIIKKYLGEYANVFEIEPDYDFSSSRFSTCILRHRLIIPIVFQFIITDDGKVFKNVFNIYIRKPKHQEQNSNNDCVYYVSYDFFEIPCDELLAYLPLLCAVAFQNRLDEDMILSRLPLKDKEYFDLDFDK